MMDSDTSAQALVASQFEEKDGISVRISCVTCKKVVKMWCPARATNVEGACHEFTGQHHVQLKSTKEALLHDQARVVGDHCRTQAGPVCQNSLLLADATTRCHHANIHLRYIQHFIQIL